MLYLVMETFRSLSLSEVIVALGHRADEVRSYIETDPPQMPLTLVDTHSWLETGGRLARLRPYLSGETFLMTWCDGLSNLALPQLLAFHQRHGRLATVVAVHPRSPYGLLSLDGNRVSRIDEKPLELDRWINAGLFILQPGILDLVEDDMESWEHSVMPKIAVMGELMAFRHEGFWHSVDTPKDALALEALCKEGQYPWLVAAQ